MTHTILKIAKVLSMVLLISSFNLHAKTILFIGDSLTEGYGIPKEKSYPQLLLNQLKKEGYKDLKLINGSISGSTTASGLSRLRWFLKAKPNILVLALGANDGLRGITPQSTKKNLNEIIKKAKTNGLKIILAGLQMPPNYGKQFTKEFEKIYFDLAKEHKLELVPSLLKNVGGVKELNQEDGIHPNIKGHEILRDNVYPHLKKLL